MITNETMARILVEDRHREIRARSGKRRRDTAIRRWARAIRRID